MNGSELVLFVKRRIAQIGLHLGELSLSSSALSAQVFELCLIGQHALLMLFEFGLRDDIVPPQLCEPGTVYCAQPATRLQRRDLRFQMLNSRAELDGFRL